MNTLKGLVKPPATPSRYPRHHLPPHRPLPKRQSTAAPPLSPTPGAPPRSPARGNPRPGAHNLPPPTPGVGGRKGSENPLSSRYPTSIPPPRAPFLPPLPPPQRPSSPPRGSSQGHMPRQRTPLALKVPGDHLGGQADPKRSAKASASCGAVQVLSSASLSSRKAAICGVNF